MPYIPNGRRAQIDAGAASRTPGELNYTLTRAITRYVVLNDLSYQTLNDIVGALDSAKAEFQRRIVAPYEDAKRIENGDVYPEVLTP